MGSVSNSCTTTNVQTKQYSKKAGTSPPLTLDEDEEFDIDTTIPYAPSVRTSDTLPETWDELLTAGDVGKHKTYFWAVPTGDPEAKFEELISADAGFPKMKSYDTYQSLIDWYENTEMPDPDDYTQEIRCIASGYITVPLTDPLIYNAPQSLGVMTAQASVDYAHARSTIWITFDQTQIPTDWPNDEETAP